MVFFLAYELCCVIKMKLFSAILAFALVFHLVHSIVLKINPIRVQVQPDHTTNASSSAAPFSSEINIQFLTTTDKFASNASFGPFSVAQNRVATDLRATEQSFEIGGRTESKTRSDKVASQQPGNFESSAKHSTTTNLNVSKYSLVTENSVEYRISTNQMVTPKPTENVSAIFLVTTNQCITEKFVRNDGSTRYSNITEEVTKRSSFWRITEEIATNESTFKHDVYAKDHPSAITTSKSLKVGPSCKIVYPLSSPASKDESSPQNEISEAITEMASTLKSSSVKNSAFDIDPDFSPKNATKEHSGSTAKFENADQSPEIPSSSSSFSIFTHSRSSFSSTSDFPTLSGVDGSTTVDSEVQISAASVKTATPHSEGYPDYEDEKEPYELGPSTRQSILLDDKKSSRDDKINQEVSEVSFSPTNAFSHSTFDSVTLAQTKENTSAACKIARVLPSSSTDVRPDNSNSSETASIRPICKTTETHHSSCHSDSCTTSIQRTSTSRALTEGEKKLRRLTISNKSPNLAKKLTRVTPLKGNISSNAGFVMVNRKYGARLFFWFVRSLRNTTRAPVIVWLQGQPGWSSLVGAFEENGPYRVVESENEIQFELREYAWTNEFNVLYLDHCIGCGYSTAMRKAAYEPTYEMVSANVYQALVQFFRVFSEYADNELYLAGEHGCAKYIPVIADTIHLKNSLQENVLNLKGMLISGPYIDAVSMSKYSEYLYVVGLIDEQEHENLFIQEQYAKSLILAAKYNETIAYLKQNVYHKIKQAGYQILYDVRFEKPRNGYYTFEQYMQKVVKYEPFVSSIHAEGLQFRTQSELLIEEIMKPVNNFLTSALKHYKMLYYNGQFDMLTPYCLTARYFAQLHWTQTDSFYVSQLNNWEATHSGYPDGYWKFNSNLTHVMIRDAGHTVGTTKPQALLYMLKWFVSNKFETSYAPPSPDQRYLNIFI